MCCHVLIPDSPPAPVTGPAQLRDNKLVVIEFRMVYCTLNYPSNFPGYGHTKLVNKFRSESIDVQEYLSIYLYFENV